MIQQQIQQQMQHQQHQQHQTHSSHQPNQMVQHQMVNNHFLITKNVSVKKNYLEIHVLRFCYSNMFLIIIHNK